MSHELEQAPDGTASISYDDRQGDLWHRLGQGVKGLMTVRQALEAARMDRHLRIEPVPMPFRLTEDGQVFEAVNTLADQYFIVLEGKEYPDGAIYPDKVVGILGKGGAEAQVALSMQDRLEIAEFTLRASEGQAVFSTAGMLRDGREGFACLELPDTVIDPNGIHDIIANYATLAWGLGGTRTTELGASNVRVVCANTLAWHRSEQTKVIEVRHTSATVKARLEQAAKHWAMAQNRAQALAILAQRLLEVRGRKMDLVTKVVNGCIGERPKDKGRTQTTWDNRLAELEVLSASKTNDVGDNGWAAYNTYTEWLDWQAPIRCREGEQPEVCRLEDQFDGKNDDRKIKAAELLLTLN